MKLADSVFKLGTENAFVVLAKAKALEAQGLQPKIEILVHGLEDEEVALRVESSVIDLIGIKNLTNKQNGYKSATFGRMSI